MVQRKELERVRFVESIIFLLLGGNYVVFNLMISIWGNHQSLVRDSSPVLFVGVQLLLIALEWHLYSNACLHKPARISGRDVFIIALMVAFGTLIAGFGVYLSTFPYDSPAVLVWVIGGSFMVGMGTHFFTVRCWTSGTDLSP